MTLKVIDNQYNRLS